MNPGRDHGVAETVQKPESDFDAALVSTGGLVVVDFWAAWCGPCRAIAPVLAELVETAAGRLTLLKVDVDERPALAARYGIRSIPTLLFFQRGQIVERVVGAVPKAALQTIIDRLTQTS